MDQDQTYSIKKKRRDGLKTNRNSIMIIQIVGKFSHILI